MKRDKTFIITYDSTHGYGLMGLDFAEHLAGLPLIQEFD